MTSLPIAAPLPVSTSQIQTSGSSSSLKNKADRQSFARLLEAHDNEPDATPQKTNLPASAAPRTAPQSKYKEPRGKATDDAVLSSYAPASQQAPVDPRSLFLSFEAAAEQVHTEKGKVTAGPTATEASDSRAASGTAPQSKDKDKELRGKATNDAVLAWHAPASQQAPVDPRSLLPSFEQTGKQVHDEKGKITTAATAIEASDSRAASRTVPQSKDKEPRRKVTDDAVLSSNAPASQQAPVDARSLLPSFEPTAKQVHGEKENMTAPATATEASDSPGAAPKPSAPVAFGVTISGVPSHAGQQSTDASSAKEVRSQTSSDTPATGPVTPGIEKGQLQTGSNGSHAQHSKDSSKDSEAARSSRMPANEHNQTPADSVAHAAAGAKADAAVPASGIPPQAHQTVLQAGLNRGPALSAPTPATHIAAVAEPPATPPASPHALNIKVGDPANGQVDVRVLQRAGGIEVTVRTPDPDLAQSLRQHLPELSDRLSQSGIHGAIWQPASGQGPSGDTNSQSDSGSAGQWQREQSDGQRRQPQQEQPNSQQDQERPEASWLNAFITADKETAS